MTTPQKQFFIRSAQKIQADVGKIETDNGAISERDQIELKSKKIELSKKDAELKELKGNIAQRYKYAERIYRLVTKWLIALFLLILIDGFEWVDISDGVLIALVGGTTANVLGLFVLVLKYLFNPNQSKK